MLRLHETVERKARRVVNRGVAEIELAIDPHQQPHRRLRDVVVERRRPGGFVGAWLRTAAVGAIGKRRTLPGIELDVVIPAAAAVLPLDERAGHVARRVTVVGVPCCLVGVQVGHADEGRAVALDLDARRSLAHLRAAVAEILGVGEVIAAFCRDPRPVELHRLPQRRLRPLAQRRIVSLTRTFSERRCSDCRGDGHRQAGNQESAEPRLFSEQHAWLSSSVAGNRPATRMPR